MRQQILKNVMMEILIMGMDVQVLVLGKQDMNVLSNFCSNQHVLLNAQMVIIKQVTMLKEILIMRIVMMEIL